MPALPEGFPLVHLVLVLGSVAAVEPSLVTAEVSGNHVWSESGKMGGSELTVVTAEKLELGEVAWAD